MGDWPGFATFYSGPALVVPPSIPALELAPLSLREAAWLIAAFCTGLGLAIFRVWTESGKGRRPPAVVSAKRAFSLALFGVRKRYSASGIYRLEHLFIVYVLGDFLLFWLVLGALSGHLFEHSADFDSEAGLT